MTVLRAIMRRLRSAEPRYRLKSAIGAVFAVRTYEGSTAPSGSPFDGPWCRRAPSQPWGGAGNRRPHAGMTAPRILDGSAGGILLICDHASNAVPSGVTLGIAPEVLDKHVGVDIGAAPLTEALAKRLHAPAVLATVSRLVIDLHRQPDHPGLIPPASDGHVIPGNATADRSERIAHFYAPYHWTLDTTIRSIRPVLLASIHSFTPRLETADGPARPWEIGILSNRDRRAADLALAMLAARGLVVGDNEPYSGRQLNATLNRHGEGRGIASLAIEVRNDLIDDAAGVAKWCDILAPILSEIRNRLAQPMRLAT